MHLGKEVYIKQTHTACLHKSSSQNFVNEFWLLLFYIWGITISKIIVPADALLRPTSLHEIYFG